MSVRAQARFAGLFLLVISLSLWQPGGIGRVAAQLKFGSIVGWVVDKQGTQIPGAEVESRGALNRDVVATDDGGMFVCRNLEPGEYTVQVSLQSMKPKSVKTRVVVGEIVRLRIELEIGVLSETVMIEQPVPPTEPTWNSWFEESGDNPTFEPLARLAPNSAYTFVLDLAAFEYDGSNAGGRSRADVRVRDWLGRSPRDLPSLTVVVVPDSSLLRIVGQHGRPLQVDRARMRNYMARNREIPVDALAELKKNPKAPFDFGSVRFPIATGSRTGRVRLAVWILGDGITPLDEMSVDACIGSDREAGSECASDRLSVQDADDLIDGRSLAKDPDPPAAALNFIDFDGERGAGMFRVRNWPAGEY